jgi:hypothetical protein
MTRLKLMANSQFHCKPLAIIEGDMAYEWGRLMWWLNQNAGAVQGMTAIAAPY